MTAFWFAVLTIVWLNIFAVILGFLVVRRERRFDRFANQAIDLTGGQR